MKCFLRHLEQCRICRRPLIKITGKLNKCDSTWRSSGNKIARHCMWSWAGSPTPLLCWCPLCFHNLPWVVSDSYMCANHFLPHFAGSLKSGPHSGLLSFLAMPSKAGRRAGTPALPGSILPPASCWPPILSLSVVLWWWLKWRKSPGKGGIKGGGKVWCKMRGSKKVRIGGLRGKKLPEPLKYSKMKVWI